MGMNKEQQRLLVERMGKVMRADPTVTVKTLAQRFGVSVSTVRRIQKAGGFDVANNRTELPTRKEMRGANAPKGHYKGGRV